MPSRDLSKNKTVCVIARRAAFVPQTAVSVGINVLGIAALLWAVTCIVFSVLRPLEQEGSQESSCCSMPQVAA